MTIKKILLSGYVLIVWVIVSVSFGIFTPFFIVYELLFKSSSLGSAVRRLIRLYGWFLVRFALIFMPVRLENRAGSLPLPVVFVANHCSAIDPYLFGLIACENAFVTSWPFKIPVHNLVMRMAEYVDARGGWLEIERQGARLLDKGSSVTIWPEGHRTRDGKLQRFRKGAFKLSVTSGRPVVPVCITGTGKILPPGHRLLRPGKIRMVILPPVDFPDVEDVETRVELIMDEAYRSIAKETACQSDN